MTLTDLLVFLVSIMIGVVSTIVYALIIWRLDRYEREPLRLLVVAFLWGAIPAVLASALIEMAFDIPLEAMIADYADVGQHQLYRARRWKRGSRRWRCLRSFGWPATNLTTPSMASSMVRWWALLCHDRKQPLLYRCMERRAAGSLGQVIAARTLAFGLKPRHVHPRSLVWGWGWLVTAAASRRDGYSACWAAGRHFGAPYPQLFRVIFKCLFGQLPGRLGGRSDRVRHRAAFVE
jgi:hypothetical protein